MSFCVQAYADGHKLTMTTETAKRAFAEAVDWHVVGRFTNVVISDGLKSYSIAEFASLMALTEIANTVEAATGHPNPTGLNVR